MIKKYKEMGQDMAKEEGKPDICMIVNTLRLSQKEDRRNFLSAARKRRKRSGYANGADHYQGTPALHRETAGYKMIHR